MRSARVLAKYKPRVVQTPKRSQFHSKAQSSNEARDAGLEFTSVISDPKEVSGPEELPSRHAIVKRLQEDKVWDILVIGGGATGAGIAFDAATRGLQVALVERGDFASETSSRSTKLIWAGIKYMGNAFASLLSSNTIFHPIKTFNGFYQEMKMVIHCHRERHYMVTKNRHLCEWLPIVVPFNTWYATPPPLGYSLYSFFPVLAPVTFLFYDSLSGFSCPSSYILGKKRAKEVFPTLDAETLKYCAVFYEAEHNDSRTNLAIALTAAQKGAAVANYVEMVDLIKEDGKVVGAVVSDKMTGKTFSIRAKKVIFAGGPFTDELRRKESDDVKRAVRAASGSHIVLPGYLLPDRMGMLDYNTSDGRFLFIIPWLGHTLIGTTDRKSDAETLQNPPENEIEWLLNEGQKYLDPKVRVDRSHVLSAWRGWRPLAADPHAPPDAPVSRDHVISENPETGVLFIAGGKWTTWREMAEEIVDRVVGKSGPGSKTLDIPLYGADGYSDTLSVELIQKYGIDRDVAENLAKTYGGRVWEVCKHFSKGGPERLVAGYPYIDAEVAFACQEYACTVEDVVSRRTRLAYLNKDVALEAIPKIANLMAKELGWSGRVKAKQVKGATAYVNSYGGPSNM